LALAITAAMPILLQKNENVNITCLYQKNLPSFNTVSLKKKKHRRLDPNTPLALIPNIYEQPTDCHKHNLFCMFDL